jgi:hypothetical protein
MNVPLLVFIGISKKKITTKKRKMMEWNILKCLQG